MKIQSRAELKDYCLRRLGQGIVKINITDEQLEDRIDDALLYWTDWHSDGSERVYLDHKITPTTLKIENVVGQFAPGEIIENSNGAKAKVWAVRDGELDTAYVLLPDSTRFSLGDTLTGEHSNSATIKTQSNSIVLGDLDNKYIEFPDNILSVTRVLPFSSLMRTSGTNFVFDPRYQMILDNMRNMQSMDLKGYVVLRQHLNLIQELFSGQKPIRFNRYKSQVRVDMDWRHEVGAGDHVIFEAWQSINPIEWPNVYNDLWLRDFTTATIKLQWGENLSKFGSIQLPGGVTLDGPRMISEAKEEIQTCKDKLMTDFVAPVPMLQG